MPIEYDARFICTSRRCSNMTIKHYKNYHDDNYYREREPECNKCGARMKFQYTNPTE